MWQKSADDTSQFDEQFTTSIPVDSPVESTLSESANLIFQVLILKNAVFILSIENENLIWSTPSQLPMFILYFTDYTKGSINH